MSTGRVHTRATIYAAPCVTGAALLLVDLPTAALAGLGCLAGIVLSPDLDQEGVSRTEWRIIHATFGVGWLWLVLSWPYACLLPHRSIWSHAPLLGTAGRVAYFGSLVAAALWLAGVTVYQEDVMWLVPFVAGLAVSDTLHWLMDL